MAFKAANLFRDYLCRDCQRWLFHNSRPLSLSRHKHHLSRGRQVSTKSESRENRPLRVGIVGSGPAGFYAAARIIQKKQDAIVDMYEKLPAPFGLVRYGVAPDHPEVKNCQEKFEEVASSSRFHFIGNVSVGDDISLLDMKPHYDCLLFAYGADTDRELGVPGEDLSGVFSARAFVGWYNGLPEYASLQPNLDASDTAYVIGNGNVALDVARTLLADLDTLRKTDIADHAIQSLAKSRIRHVKICGRRGPMQAAFTIKEVRELLSMRALAFEPIDSDLLPQADYLSALPRLEQRKYRLPQLLSKGSPEPLQTSLKSWALESLVAPTAFLGSSGHLAGIRFTRNRYDNDDERFNPKARVHATEEYYELPTSTAFRSIGYKSTALKGLEADLGIPFNDLSGIIPNDMQGRILAQASQESVDPAVYVAGCYCTGWVKRGPTGVIASTMEDAFASADAIIADWENDMEFLNGSSKSHRKGSGDGWPGIVEKLRQSEQKIPRWVSWQDWQAINEAEQQRGKAIGKPREKFNSPSAMLAVLD